jgi:hypothetical protein
MAKQISEITKRDLREVLAKTKWWGRLEETEFLQRLYSLDDMSSYDSRYKTAAQDIFQHRINNNDWPDDWVFTDDRFGVGIGEDEELLRFLTEMLHPAVRHDAESQEIVDKLNPLLRRDGYQIVPNGAISGHPTYGWERVDPQTTSFNRHFTKDIAPLIATITELAREDGASLELRVLEEGRASLEEPEYDNWDGGTYYYTLTLTVPVPLFAQLGDGGSDLEQSISKRINQLQRGPDKHRITAVVIQPGMARSLTAATALSRVIDQRSQAPVPAFWTPGKFRLFLSHVSQFRQRTAALRDALAKFHISGFVAHDTIEPGELWQREIEAALKTMDAMAAILTPEFPDSDWTDQEVGWALGARVYVLPVRRGLDPYGFIAEVQGVNGTDKRVGAVANEIFNVLLKQKLTRDRLLEAVVTGFERSATPVDAGINGELVERGSPYPPALAQRLEAATTSNRQVAAVQGLRERIQRVARAVGKPSR